MHRRAALVFLVALLLAVGAWLNTRSGAEVHPSRPRIAEVTDAGGGAAPVAVEARGPSTPAPPDVTARATLSGRVVIRADEPVSGAALVFTRVDGRSATTRSATDGTFQLELDEGAWALSELTAPDLVGPIDRTPAFDLAAGSSLDGLLFKMQRLVWVEGDVVDSDEHPLEGARVAGVVTDAKGAFRARVPENLAGLQATHPCCAPSRMVGRDLDRDRVQITLETLLPRLGDVRGVVLDDGDVPAAGAVISFMPRETDGGLSLRGWKLAFETTADTEGRFSAAVGTEAVSLIASTERGTSAAALARPGDHVTLRVMPTDRVLRGRLVDSDGAAIERFTLSVMLSKHEFVTTSGRFVLAGLERTRTFVWVEGPTPESFLLPTVDLSAGDVDLGDVRVPSARTVKGTVVASDTRAPIPDARIECAGRKERSDGAGRFTLRGLREGPQLVLAWASGFQGREQRVDQGPVTIELDRVTADGGRGTSYEGVGMRYELDGGVVVEVRGPALEAGVNAGDQLVAIDDVPLASFPDGKAAIAAIKGPAGTVVKLTFRRAGRLFDVRVSRRRIVW